ncbi:MAG: MATE family efflux transporter [Clostridiales bacterium]|nr:MATE family efflux transporter [Clostridiales bacterium]
MNKDLTVGNPRKVLRNFCLPLFGSIIFQQIYNIADSLIAGKFIGENALAAVGNSYEITLIFIAFAFGCNIGSSVVVAELFGSKKYGEVKTAVRTAMISSGILCLTLMLIGILGSNALMDMIHTPENIYADSELYLDIYIWGLPFVFFYNIATGIFSALGDSKTPFWFLVASSSSNIFVDILFVKVLHMGVAGVAWATFLCQGVSCILSMIVICKRLSKLAPEVKGEPFSTFLLKKIARVAIPSILQQSFISIGNILIQRVINGFGSGVIAGYSAAIKLNNLVITSFTTLANGISNFTAQNIGANKLHRIKEGFRAGLRMVWILSLPLALLYLFAGRYLVMFFMDQPSNLALKTGIQILQIFSPFYFVVSAKLVADGILRGSGRMIQFMIATFTDLSLRVILAFILSKTGLQELGIWCAWPIGWGIACLISVHYYHAQKWGEKGNEKDYAEVSF